MGKAKSIIREIEPDVKITVQPKAKDGNKPVISRPRIIVFAIGIAVFAAAFLFPLSFGPRLALYIASYLLIGHRVLLRAGRNIAKGQIFDENFLMCAATVGAFGIGEFPEGVSVMLFYQIGEFFQDAAVSRSRKSIEKLMDIRPDYANIESGGALIRVSPEEIRRGDTIVVKPGEKVPLDGVVSSGVSALDTSSLTGEALPRDVQEGSEVALGFGKQNGGSFHTGDKRVQGIHRIQNIGTCAERRKQKIAHRTVHHEICKSLHACCGVWRSGACAFASAAGSGRNVFGLDRTRADIPDGLLPSARWCFPFL